MRTDNGLAAAALRRLTPMMLKALPVDTIGNALERKRSQGDKDGALRLARTLTGTIPRSGKARRFLVRTLLTPPISLDDLAEARAEADIMLSLWEDAAVQRLYADVLIMQHTMGVDAIQFDAEVATFAAVRPQSRHPAVRRILVHLIATNEPDHAIALSGRLARILDLDEYWLTAHDMAIKAGRTDVAEAIENEARPREWSSDEGVTTLVVNRLALEQRAHDAASLLDEVKPRRSPQFSRQYVEALMSVGEYTRALQFLDDTYHQLPAADEASLRFDLMFTLGRAAEAHELISEPEPDRLTDVRLFRQLRDSFEAVEPERCDELASTVREFETEDSTFRGSADTAVRLYFELDRLDDVERLAADPYHGWQISELGTYAIALTHYCRRRFDAAVDVIDQLRGTIRHWEAEKLRSRIIFELGDDARAIQHRADNHRADGEVDEVVYHALLHQQRYTEAFTSYLRRRERMRFESTFGDRCDFGPTFEHVGERAVIMQDGPGDELQLSGVLPTLAQWSDRLTVVCEPRLESLLRRSFPDIRYVSAERMRSRRHAGFLADDRPPRAIGPMFELLTEEAAAAIEGADRVMLGRTLQQVSLQWAGPPERYLVPDPDLVEHDSRLRRPTDRPRIGIVWRSEFGSAMRNIHYLGLSDLRPLLELDVDIVNLQHDITADERAVLDSTARHPVEYLDEIDLRDDFEHTAAVVAQLDAVVGVGTTMLELAGGLGTRAIMLQPTRFGTWRAARPDGGDYWHANVTVIAPPSPDDRPACGREASRLISAWCEVGEDRD